MTIANGEHKFRVVISTVVRPFFKHFLSFPGELLTIDSEMACRNHFSIWFQKRRFDHASRIERDYKSRVDSFLGEELLDISSEEIDRCLFRPFS